METHMNILVHQQQENQRVQKMDAFHQEKSVHITKLKYYAFKVKFSPKLIAHANQLLNHTLFYIQIQSDVVKQIIKYNQIIDRAGQALTKLCKVKKWGIITNNDLTWKLKIFELEKSYNKCCLDIKTGFSLFKYLKNCTYPTSFFHHKNELCEKICTLINIRTEDNIFIWSSEANYVLYISDEYMRTLNYLD